MKMARACLQRYNAIASYLFLSYLSSNFWMNYENHWNFHENDIYNWADEEDNASKDILRVILRLARHEDELHAMGCASAEAKTCVGMARPMCPACLEATTRNDTKYLSEGQAVPTRHGSKSHL